MRDLLLEIGTEEIPAHFMPNILSQLRERAGKMFKEAHLSYKQIETLGTPRRLALSVTGLADKQDDVSTSYKGPSVKIAYDQDNQLTKAALGFARSKKVEPSDLRVENGYIYAEVHEQGKPATAILQTILPELIEKLTFPKSMHWGNLDFRFVRPIRWLVALYGTEIIPFSIANVNSGRVTRGHRFLGNKEEYTITVAEDYKSVMQEAFVMVDQEERSNNIESQIKKLARENGGEAAISAELLEEVTYLVEYPTALCGHFSAEYLQLPKEAVITPMREHQRYFPVLDKEGKLLPLFITVRNGGAHCLETVQHGNERVLRARLEDAKFFFTEDRKKPLVAYLEKLKNVVFREDYGSMYDKTVRLQKLGAYLSDILNITEEEKVDVQRAALLAKADLVTAMVTEFTELQGIMGREYALLDGEKEIVARAIDQHYRPRFAGDAVPDDIVSSIVSISDKIDTIVAAFAAGAIPTGSQDPFALRRQALGIMLNLIEHKVHISIGALIEKSMELLQIPSEKQAGLLKQVLEFMSLRLKNILTEAEVRYDIIDAVNAEVDDPFAVYKRAFCLAENLTNSTNAELILQSFVRVSNIAQKYQVGTKVEEALFQLPAEKTLYASYLQARKVGEEALHKYDYQKLWEALIVLEPVITGFFDQVMVMDKDEKLRNNRLALLHDLDLLIKKLADFNKLVH